MNEGTEFNPFVILIGLRASGKTTCGRLVAQRFGVSFVDLDDLTMAKFPDGSVEEVWSNRGEEAWRAAEVVAIHELLSNTERNEGLVLALGGGTPMIAKVREYLNNLRRSRLAVVVYLRATADVLQKRLRRDTGDRPSLTGAHPWKEVPHILSEREPTFLELADLVVDGDTSDYEELTVAIVEQVRELL